MEILQNSKLTDQRSSGSLDRTYSEHTPSKALDISKLIDTYLNTVFKFIDFVRCMDTFNGVYGRRVYVALGLLLHLFLLSSCLGQESEKCA